MIYETEPRETLQAMTAGTMMLPANSAATKSQALVFIGAALRAGHDVPQGWLFASGQLFWRDGKEDEIRLLLVSPNEPRQVWTTPTPPRIEQRGDSIYQDDEEEGRPYTSAIICGDEQGKEYLFLAADLRNAAQIVAPRATPEATQSDTYNIITSQEIAILERSAANGKRGQNWKALPKARKHVYEEKGAPFHVELMLSDPEQYEEDAIVETKMNALGSFIKDQDADFVFALFYVCSQLAPPAPLPPHATAIGWIDLEDVAEKIGWNPSKRSRAEREAMRAQVWKFIRYGDRATVKGERTIPYHSKTGEVIPTRIESAVWRIMDTQRPEQTELWGETPQRVQIAIGKQWEPLLTHPRLAQYLPLGELLGSIPAKQVAGSWARVIGLVLAGLWRRHPRETLDKTLRVTRRELLTTYTPKTKTVDELLDSKDPRHAVTYWLEALSTLRRRGIIASEGEGDSKRTVADVMKPYDRSYGWQKKWLNEEVLIVPGPKFMPHIEERAVALPPIQPKALPRAKRPGRPRKKREKEE